MVSNLAALAPLIGALPNEERARELVRHAMSSSSAKALVVEGAGLIAVESQNLWTQKRHTQIVALWAETPYQYEQLINACIEWFESRRGSMMLCYIFPAETQADTALALAGFEPSGSMLVRRK